MWAILKFDKKNLSLLKKDLKNKLDKNLKFYSPKIKIQKFKNNKLVSKELNLMGDYLFCYHESLKCTNKINTLKFTRGLKYFLNGFKDTQKDIEVFIENCKNSENDEGFLSKEFFEIELNKKYKFSSGPFTEKIFQIINLQKNKIKILMGDLKTTIRRKDYLFSPL